LARKLNRFRPRAIHNSFNSPRPTATAAPWIAVWQIPLIEIGGNLRGRDTEFTFVDLQIRNLGSTVAVSPVPELNAPSNVWPVKSLAGQESMLLG
jgi:hypothetical protein